MAHCSWVQTCQIHNQQKWKSVWQRSVWYYFKRAFRNCKTFTQLNTYNNTSLSTVSKEIEHNERRITCPLSIAQIKSLETETIQLFQANDGVCRLIAPYAGDWMGTSGFHARFMDLDRCPKRSVRFVTFRTYSTRKLLLMNSLYLIILK